MAQTPEYIAAVKTATVQKLGYSRDPWRIVTTDGLEVCRAILFEHPEKAIGITIIQESGFRTKKDARYALYYFNQYGEWPPETSQ